MASLPLTQRTFTPEEYLTIERQAAYRSEYLNGVIYAMAGASPEHTTITDNLTMEIGIRLKGTPCQGISQDRIVQVGEQGLYAYPDYLIVCGEKQYRDAARDVLLNPLVLIEVLSPTTEQYDRTTKFDLCKQIESLREYVLVSQVTPRIERYIREADDT
jgi:Uma2 family endonuclease